MTNAHPVAFKRLAMQMALTGIFIHSRILLARSLCYADAAQTRMTAQTYPNKWLFNTWYPARDQTSQGPSSILMLFQKRNLSFQSLPTLFPASSAPREIGALPPPPGVNPNFIDPYSIGEGLKAAGNKS